MKASIDASEDQKSRFELQFSRSVMSDSLQSHRLKHGQASLSITNSRSVLKLKSLKSVMPSQPSVTLFSSCLQSFPASDFSSESVLCLRWPKYWSFSFSISPSNEYSGLISFRIDCFHLLAVQGTF